MSSERITAVIVVYNKKVSESITCQMVKDIEPAMDIFIIDNSEIETGNAEYCKKNGIRYMSMDGNKGLSKAYNRAVDNSLSSDVIILFDDDTEITSEYFEKLRIALDEHPEIDIFAPVVRGQDGVIYSPNEFNFLKNNLVMSSTQTVSRERFNAIASCLAIRIRVFDNYRFNEKLFVDQVDQFFFCEQRCRRKTFGVLDVEILQHFYQRSATLTPEAGWNRLKLRIVDLFRHARLMGGNRYTMLAFIKSCGLGVQIGKKTRSIRVMFKAGLLSCKLIFIDL